MTYGAFSNRSRAATRRRSWLGATAIWLGLAAAGLGLGSSTAQARAVINDPGCKTGMICLYDKIDYDTRNGSAFVRRAVSELPALRSGGTVDLNAFGDNGILRDSEHEVSSWINNSDARVCVVAVVWSHLQRTERRLWTMSPRLSRLPSRSPSVGNYVNNQATALRAC